MDGQTIGFISIAALLGLILVGAPIGLAMILIGFSGFAAIVGIAPALSVLKTAAFETASNYSFSIIPLFLLMGNFMSQSGMARDLFIGSARLTRGWNGGIAAAGVTASAAFSTVSGSSIATATTMTRVAYPEMEKMGYDKRLATGSLAAGGTLGIMIPPSIALLLYALITEQSVSDMFLAGILPGLLAYALYMLTILVMARFWPPLAQNANAATPSISIQSALTKFLPVAGLFALVMGGLYGGFFTPTEAGGAGAALAFIYAVYRGMRWAGFKNAASDTIATTAAVFYILIGAEVFGYLLSTSQISFGFADFLAGQNFSPFQVLLLIMLFYIILGCVMESLAMILLTVPIFYPIIVANGFDPVWFGIIAVVTVELGLITPPVGLNIFMVRSVVKQLHTKTIMAGVLPFVLVDVLRLAILIAFPAIALYLPGRL